MTNTFRLGSIFGVTIAVHFTWFVIFALITFSMAGTFAASFPGLPHVAHLLIGVVASLLFFGSVLFHEMAHSLMAIRGGKPVRSITLFIFGGVSEIGKEADRPGEEIRIALVGPVSSYFLAAVFGGVWLLSRGRAPVIGEVSQWLATVNLILGTFNLLPGIPLDGGRVLRGIAWSVTGDKDRATRLAVGAGRTIGYLMIQGDCRGWLDTRRISHSRCQRTAAEGTRLIDCVLNASPTKTNSGTSSRCVSKWT